MSDEAPVFIPKGREAANVPVYEYGNGVQLEKKVWAKSLKVGISTDNMDVIKIHFLPKKSDSDTSEQLAPEERNKVRVDALKGHIELAQVVAQKQLLISEHNPDEDFYLCATTNSAYAFFLTSNCGFHGNFRDGMVYMLASEFSSATNQQKMLETMAGLNKQLH